MEPPANPVANWDKIRADDDTDRGDRHPSGPSNAGKRRTHVVTDTTRHARVLSLFLLGVSVLFGIIAAATSHWMTATTPAHTYNIGIFQWCVDGSCGSIPSNSFQCPAIGVLQDTGVLKARYTAVQATTIIGIIFGVGGIAAGVRTYQLPMETMWKASVVFSGVSSAVYGMSVFIYAHTMGSWYNCGQDYCAGIIGCTWHLDYSFGLIAVSAVTSFASIIVFGISPVTPDMKSGRGRSAPKFDMEEVRQTQQRGASEDIGVTFGPPPDGDWRFDNNSGLYWSDEKQYYLDPTTGEYYDPGSQMWYDSQKGEWYS